MPPLSPFYAEVTAALYKKDLIGALYQLKAWLSTLSKWELESEWENIANGYRALLSYQIDGKPDEQRSKMYAQFLRSTWALAEKARRDEGMKTSSNEYYIALRSLNTSETAEDIIKRIENLQQQLLFDKLTSDGEQDYLLNRQQETEQLARSLFLVVWTSEEWSTSTKAYFTSAMQSPALPDYIKDLLVSAVMLALNDIFDTNKILFLAETCNHSNLELRQRALISLALTLRLNAETITYYEELHLCPELSEKLHELFVSTSAIHDFASIQFHLFNCAQADEIQRTIHEEIMPGIIKSGLGGKRFINLNEIEELLEDGNDINKHFDADTAKELKQGIEHLMELHNEGMDLYYTSFRGLKTHPFFSKISNWFLPFSEEQTEVSQLLSNNKELLHPIIESQSMCNSDLYSLCFLMAQFPHDQMGMMREQLRNMLGDVVETKGQRVNERRPESIRTAILQDYFRFFTLYRGRKSFHNPFSSEYNLLPEISILQKHFSNSSLREMAYWAHKHLQWDTAIRLFNLIDDKTNSTDIQLLAEAQEQLGKVDDAINNYRHTLILNPHNDRVKLHLGRLLTKQEKYDEAANLYKQIVEQHPDNISALFHYGECLLEMGHADKALPHFLHIDYLKPHYMPAMRAITWCSLLVGQLQQAENYYRRIEANNPNPEDHIYGGHTAWLSGDTRLAVTRYRRFTSSAVQAGKIFHFSEDDIRLLTSRGLHAEDIHFMEDYLNLPENL